MAGREDVDVDDDFSEIYKAYSGPLGSNPSKPQNITTNKRSHDGSDEEEEVRDPNAVPTDFTSREAKVWEAKSKATERNWKKRKEEEMICKLCGESGHFTQGCPSTLGANRKSQDFFERVPARDPHVKALFSEGVINKIEKDIGCKIKIDEKFIIVSGKDRVILKKGVDAVHKIKEEGGSKSGNRFTEEGEPKGSSSSPVSHTKSLECRLSPLTSRLRQSDSQKSNPSPHSASHIPHRYGRPEKKIMEDHVREHVQKFSSGSPRDLKLRWSVPCGPNSVITFPGASWLKPWYWWSWPVLPLGIQWHKHRLQTLGYSAEMPIVLILAVFYLGIMSVTRLARPNLSKLCYRREEKSIFFVQTGFKLIAVWGILAAYVVPFLVIPYTVHPLIGWSLYLLGAFSLSSIAANVFLLPMLPVLVPGLGVLGSLLVMAYPYYSNGILRALCVFAYAFCCSPLLWVSAVKIMSSLQVSLERETFLPRLGENVLPSVNKLY